MKRIKKILLVSPTYIQSGLISRYLRFVPLSLAQLASLAPNYQYSIIDENIKPLDFNVDLKGVDLVGITMMTVQAPRAYAIADRLRSMGKIVIMGGSHASAMPKEAKEHADAIVIGEAEESWPRLLEDVQSGHLKEFYHQSKPSDLSNLPFPQRNILLEKYKYFFPNTLQVGRGCPFDCSFCSVTRFFGHQYRSRPIPEIVREIKEMKNKNGGKTIVFMDDNIFGNPNYAKRLFKALIPLKIFWGSQSSINITAEEENIKLAAASGCKFLFIGLESVSKSTIKEIGKKQNNPDFYKQAVELLHKYGIAVLGAFIFGFDNDKKNVFRQTVKFSQAIKLDMAQFTVLTPLPNTRLREKLIEEHRIISSDWSKYSFGNVVFQPANLSVKELAEGNKQAWQKFYSLGSIAKRFPMTDKQWWKLLKKSPKSAWIRLFVYLFANFGFHFQVWHMRKYPKIKEH